MTLKSMQKKDDEKSGLIWRSTLNVLQYLNMKEYLSYFLERIRFLTIQQ